MDSTGPNAHEVGFHDHFTVPSNEVSEEDRDQLAALSPRLKEMFQRYSVEYHLSESFYSDPDHILVGFHIEEAVYAPLYYGYGGKGEYAERSAFARRAEAEIMLKAPDTVLVLLKASSNVIAQRMKETPHHRGAVQEKDIEVVLERFDEEFRDTLIRKHFVLDTSNATVEETLKEFVSNIEHHLTDADRLRILAHQALG